jgi:hypothetical protein
MCAVLSAPGAASVRGWHIISRARGPRTGPPPPEGAHVTYPLNTACILAAESTSAIQLLSGANQNLAEVYLEPL